ncbi:nitrogen fixation protein NifB [Smithella sp. SC_K08D17]|jgi:nitrogen fixation protein NifB|nr:nitrogen fixation protein NifB [Smithella sp. SC_K08D17]MDD5523496.1 radical SAM protein [Kiritimatiellia bacterium]
MDTNNHPCFSEGARHRTGRIHLPVAPNCNMQCNYCNRDFECVNESRPGVSGAILLPGQAADYLDEVLDRIKNIAVVGIAGPGDPFANPEKTLTTLYLVRKRHPEMMLCVATNGLALADYVDELADIQVSHVTVTVNAIDPAIAQKIYAWARLPGHVYRGADAAGIIIENQQKAIRLLKAKGLTVKINTVVIPGINDHHVVEIAKTMKELKADIFNAIPMYHVAGTPFAGIAPLPEDKIATLRKAAGSYLPQMNHCSRCRADAAGLIGEKQNQEIVDLLKKASLPGKDKARPYVAVASMEGIFVNQHLGESAGLWIYGLENGKAVLQERRNTPAAGGGQERWEAMALLLQDCNTILASGIGPRPLAILEQRGFQVLVMDGLAKEGVEAILTGKAIPKILLRTAGHCGIGKQCSGNGMGCG